MAHADIILPTQPARELPAIRSIGLTDLKIALAKGLDDFRAMPTHVVFLSLIYPIAGLALWRATLGYDVVPLLYPLAAGFALAVMPRAIIRSMRFILWATRFLRAAATPHFCCF